MPPSTYCYPGTVILRRRHISRSDHDNDEDDDEVVCCAAMSVTGRVWLLSTLAATAIFVCLLNLGVGIYYSPSTRTTDDYDTHHHHGVAPPRMTALLPRHAASPATTMDHHHRPPLDSILQGEWNITGDVSWLLHFAVIGHPKCATSTMMKLLGTHPEVSIFQDERCDLAYNQQAKLIRDSYLYLKTNTTRGFKCPALLESTQLGMRNAIRFFPKMKYIVGIRHPVLWFESFYNFRIHNEFPMPPPNELIGRCYRRNFNVCTFRSNFHLFLSNLLALNPMMGPDELKYIDSRYHKTRDPFLVGTGLRPQVFLYEVSQLTSSSNNNNNNNKNNNNTTREHQIRTALQSFLGLTNPIPPFIWFKPGRNHSDSDKLEKLNAKKIDICQPQYLTLRDVLQKQAVSASRWIRAYFLKAPQAFVSDREHFTEIMKSWEVDPCLQRTSEPSR